MDDYERDDSLGTWATHPYTTRMAEVFREERSNAFERLLGVCHRSTDPAVRAAAMDYAHRTRISTMFAERTAGKDTMEGR